MKAGIVETYDRKYHAVEVREGEYYLYADQENAADNVYHGYTNRQQEGFGGRHITFELVDGGEITLKGPFHCGGGGLLKHGIDLSNKYLTFGVISKKRERTKHFMCDEYRELVHLDGDWVLGKFHRIEELAQELANEHGCKMYFYARSQGGSTAFYKEPQQLTQET
jgi:hypothetical protein